MTSIWVDLPRPRQPTPGERRVLDALVARAGCATLTEQLASVTVTATCTCGCSSVRLDTAGAPLTPAAVAELSSTGRDDWISLNASAGLSSVVVHVLAGRMHELELFAGEGVPVEPPTDLGTIWID